MQRMRKEQGRKIPRCRKILEQVSASGCIWIWCVEYQIDLFIQSLMREVEHDSFYKPMISLLSFCVGKQLWSTKLEGSVLLSVPLSGHQLYQQKSGLFQTEFNCRVLPQKAKLNTAWKYFWILGEDVKDLMTIIDICFISIQNLDTLATEHIVMQLHLSFYDSTSCTVNNFFIDHPNQGRLGS